MAAGPNSNRRSPLWVARDDRGDPRRPGSDFHADPFAAFLALPLLFFPGLIFAGIWSQLVAPIPREAPELVEWSLGFQACNVVLLCGYAWAVGRRPGWGSGTLRGTVGLWAIAFSVWLGVLWGYLVLMRVAGHPVTPQGHLDYFFGGATSEFWWWAVTLVICVIGPIGEEVAFRGMIQDLLRKVFDPLSSLVVTALVFGLVHGVEYAAPLALVGLFFGWLRERTGGLAAPIVAHCLHNTAVVILSTQFPEWIRSMYAGIPG